MKPPENPSPEADLLALLMTNQLRIMAQSQVILIEALAGHFKKPCGRWRASFSQSPR